MKFLLVAINAKYIHSNPAIYSLRAFAGEENRDKIELCEYTINQYSKDILADIYKRKPTTIAFSCYIWNWEMVEKLLPELPKILPGVDIWLGGPEVSFHPEKLLQQFPYVKGVMIGEGEETFLELLNRYEELGTGFEDIRGLYLAGGYTGDRELTDMSKLPFLYDNLDQFENKIIYYESSRGCPYQCSYCLSSIDKKVRFRDIETVKRELQYFLNHRVDQVKFIDRTFNCNHERTREIWTYLLEHDNGVTNFHFEISADIITEEEIALLNRMRPGLVQLEIGVQSTNPTTIQAINRHMNVEKLEQVVAEIAKEKNVHQHLDLIAGLPYEDLASFKRSFDEVYGMHPQQLQLGFLKVLKGSPMEEEAKSFGIQYLDSPPYEVLSTRWLSFDEVLRLHEIEDVVEIFYNSGQFEQTIAWMETHYSSVYHMYELLADFYNQGQYALKSPARVKRYETLYTFLKEYVIRTEEEQELALEFLAYDLYLREKIKSRPAFLPELPKNEIYDIYRQEEKTRTYLPDYREYDHKQLSKMTHLEPFYHLQFEDGELVWKNERSEKPEYVLFDYRNQKVIRVER